MKRARIWMSLQIAFLALASTGLAACGEEDEPSSVPPNALQLESRTLVEYLGSGEPYHERARLLIQDANEWEQWWSQSIRDGTPMPEVDFSRDMVVVTAMGVVNTSGYTIKVEGVFEDADGLYIQVEESSPAPRCGGVDAIFAPVTVVAIPRRDKPVFWVERAYTYSC